MSATQLKMYAVIEFLSRMESMYETRLEMQIHTS